MQGFIIKKLEIKSKQMEEKLLEILSGKNYNVFEFKRILIKFYKDNEIKIPSHYVMFMIWDEYSTTKKIVRCTY